MKTNITAGLSLFLFVVLLAGCSEKTPFQDVLQERLILAEKGDIIELEEGVFEITRTLSLMDKQDIIIRGRGMGKTVLRFDNQVEGAEGILISNGVNIILEDFSVYNTAGDGVKARDCNGITFRNLEVIWEGVPDTTHGAYGLYPVTSRNVIVEDCRVRGASDAGIYVGQSRNAIVRNNHTYENVCGIEVENSFEVEVYDNLTENNTTGIMVVNLPELEQINGSDVRVFNNEVIDNNFYNYAQAGNLANMIPSGVGMIIMAYRNVDVFDNVFSGNGTVNISVSSYFVLDRPYDDENFYPYSNSINIFRNTLSNAGQSPDMENPISQFMVHLFGDQMPDIFVDAYVDPEILDEEGNVFPEKRICIAGNELGSVGKWNMDEEGNQSVSFDLSEFDCELNLLPSWSSEQTSLLQ